MPSRPRISTRLPDPTRRFSNVNERRVPQLEFGAPIPMIRGTLLRTGASGPGITASDGNRTEIVWDYWEITDDRFFAEGTIVGGKLESFECIQDGQYTFRCETKFDDETVIPARSIMLNVFQPPGLLDAWDFSKWETWAYTPDQLEGMFCFNYEAEFPPYDPEHFLIDPEDLPESWNCLWQCNQNSGADAELVRAEFAVYYRGPLLTREYRGA